MKIICIGRNYANHAKEMGSAVPSEPVFFMKPDTALLLKNKPFYYPDFSKEINYETEIVLKINRVGKYIKKKFAHRYYNKIGLGIDLTARDLQRKCKINGLPWEKAKSFDNSAPLSKRFFDKNKLPDNINFYLKLNGSKVQTGNTKEMIFSFDEIIEHISKFCTLKIGDLIFTGTPEGVGNIKIGDRLQGYIEDKCILDFEIK